MDSFKPTPPTVQVQLESIPSGADAKTSLGPGCKTPCTVAVPAADGGFTVTYTMNRFQPVTVPVQVIQIPRRFHDPGLHHDRSQPGGRRTEARGPAAKPVRKPMRPKKPKPRSGRARGIAVPAPAAAARPLIASPHRT